MSTSTEIDRVIKGFYCTSVSDAIMISHFRVLPREQQTIPDEKFTSCKKYSKTEKKLQTNG